MSDRVAYAVGNTNRRDHIYWPILSPAQATTRSLPSRALGVNLATVMALAWRVRKWRVTIGTVTGSLHQIFPGTGGTQTDEVISTEFEIAEFDVEMVNMASREAGLLDTFARTFDSGAAGGLLHSGWSGQNTDNVSETTTLIFNSTPPEFFDPPSGTDSGIFTSSAGGRASIQIGADEATGGFNGVYFDSATNLFYPEIIFGIDITLHFGGQFRLGADMRDLTGTDGTLTIDPIITDSFELPLKATGFIVPFRGHVQDPATVTGFADADMTAIEFWPYANSEGDPVYDTGSGTQLLDPFS